MLWCVFSVNYGYWDQFLHNKSDHKIIVALENHCGVKLSTSFFILRKLLNKSIHSVNVCGRRWMGSLRASAWSKGFTFGVGGWTRGPSETMNPLTYNLEADPCVLSLSICAEKCLLVKWGIFPGWPRSSKGSKSIYLRTLWIFLQQTNKTSLSINLFACQTKQGFLMHREMRNVSLNKKKKKLILMSVDLEKVILRFLSLWNVSNATSWAHAFYMILSGYCFSVVSHNLPSDI